MLIESFCPECDTLISFSEQPAPGQRLICAYCKSTLTVMQVNPMVLDWAFLEPINPSKPHLGERFSIEAKNQVSADDPN